MDGSCALHCAAFRLDCELLTKLVERGGSVNAVDMSGFTPLMVAAESVPGRARRSDPHPSSEAVDVLLALGADPALTDAAGMTALGHYRMRVRHYDDFSSALFTSAGTRG